MGDRVQETVWNWRVPAATPAPPGPLALLARTLWVLAVAALLLVLGHRTAALIAGGIGLVLMGLGLAAPAAWLAVARLGDRFAAAVGRLLGVVLLTPVFGLVILPAGLALRIAGRDPLDRRFREPGLTYWIRRRTVPEAGQYARQFLVEDRGARTELRTIARGDPDSPADADGGSPP